MLVRVTENSLPSVSFKFVLKGLLPEEHIGDLKVSGIIRDGRFFIIPMLPWEQDSKIWISRAEKNLHNSMESLLSQEAWESTRSFLILLRWGTLEF